MEQSADRTSTYAAQAKPLGEGPGGFVYEQL